MSSSQEDPTLLECLAYGVRGQETTTNGVVVVLEEMVVMLRG